MESKGLLSCLASVVLAITLPAMVVARQFFGTMIFRHEPWALAGGIFLLMAGFITVVNIHTSFRRNRIRIWLHGNLDGFQFASGVPVLGSLFVFLSSICYTQSPMIGTLLVIAIMLDTGGVLWIPRRLFIDWYSGTNE